MPPFLANYFCFFRYFCGYLANNLIFQESIYPYKTILYNIVL